MKCVEWCLHQITSQEASCETKETYECRPIFLQPFLPHPPPLNEKLSYSSSYNQSRYQHIPSDSSVLKFSHNNC